jgi:hypothetical protein
VTGRSVTARWAHHDLVDVDVGRLFDREGDGTGDRLGLDAER